MPGKTADKISDWHFSKKQFADYFEEKKIESGRPQFIKNQPNVQNTVTIVRFVAIVYKVVS